jgi:hypothetical protein
MLINDLVGMLMDVPPKLAGAWGVWFVVGLVLSIWQRRERARLVVEGPAPRKKPGVPAPAFSRTVKPAMNAPASGDPFGDLASLFETEEPRSGLHRRPGDDASPTLAAPQSLP